VSNNTGKMITDQIDGTVNNFSESQ